MAKRGLHKIFAGAPVWLLAHTIKVMAVLGMEDNDAVKWYSPCIQTHSDLSKC